MTPHSGVRLTAAPVSAREDATQFYAFEVPAEFAANDRAPSSGTRVGPFDVVPREPATEPHLVAADPFDAMPTQARPASERRERDIPVSPLSATRLDIAPPVVSTRLGAQERTLCSVGVVHAEAAEVTHLHFRFDAEPVTSVAGVPQPMARSVSSWASALSDMALRMVLGIARLFGARSAR